jgi:hypothetical protein
MSRAIGDDGIEIVSSGEFPGRPKATRLTAPPGRFGAWLFSIGWRSLLSHRAGPVTEARHGQKNILFPIGASFKGGVSVVDLDTDGISVSTTLGDYHIFSDGSPFSKGTVSGNDIFETGPCGFGVGTLAVSAVPEPSAWAMMILGFVGIGAMTYRRKQKMALNAA